MEYMLTPRGPTAAHTRVPFLEGKSRWDGGDWLSYPHRRGYSSEFRLLQPSENADHGAVAGFLMGAEKWAAAELEQFLQSWLFFGLGAEFLFGNEIIVTLENGQEKAFPAETPAMVSRLYENVVRRDENCAGTAAQYLNTSDLLLLIQSAWFPRPPGTRESMIRRCLNLQSCVKWTQSLFYFVGSSISREVRYSIGSLGEIITHSMAIALRTFNLEPMVLGRWVVDFYGKFPMSVDYKAESRQRMLDNGWCRSDISRCMDKCRSFQMQYFLSLMDRRKPKRDHSKCTALHCEAFQIVMGEYVVRHVEDGCDCELAELISTRIIHILEEGECFPLLKITGDKYNMGIEVVKSSPDIPYIAISHVWADGLGNPNQNALQSCQLVRLRKLIEGVHNSASESQPGSPMPLLWIDTLCCPVTGDAKKLSIAKIRHVYKNAQYVLVLDSSLSEYESKSMETVEILARIFTSGWFRRLWTLQEGTLARSLYFHFADASLSLEKLFADLSKTLHLLVHRIIYTDLSGEHRNLKAFFYSQEVGCEKPDFLVMDHALQHRSVSVATDEPLCIATLMSISLDAVLAVKEENRMAEVWKLLSEKYGGIPAHLIFSEEDKLPQKGFRWAIGSFLNAENTVAREVVTSLETRQSRWFGEQRGRITEDGLQVTFPGFRLHMNNEKDFNDGKPTHPWPGIEALPESQIFARAEDGKTWFSLTDTTFAMRTRHFSEEELEKFLRKRTSPLTDILAQGDVYLVAMDDADMGHTQSFLASDENASESSGSAFYKTEQDTNVVELSGSSDRGHSLHIHIKRHVILTKLTPEISRFWETVRDMAYRLRSDEKTAALLAIDRSVSVPSGESQAGPQGDISQEAQNEQEQKQKEAIDVLKQAMKDMMKETLKNDRELATVANTMWHGRQLEDDVWVLIGSFFYHDVVATALPSDQVWVVD